MPPTDTQAQPDQAERGQPCPARPAISREDYDEAVDVVQEVVLQEQAPLEEAIRLINKSRYKFRDEMRADIRRLKHWNTLLIVGLVACVVVAAVQCVLMWTMAKGGTP